MQIDLSTGTLDYVDTGGDGPTVVLLHGLLMDSSLWDGPLADLPPTTAASRRRCRSARTGAPCPATSRCPRSPAGRGVPGPAGPARRHAGRQRHRRRAGPAVLAGKPERVGRVVLVSCEAFDNVPPGLTGKVLVLSGKLSPRLFGAFMQQLRLRAARRLPIAFGWLTKRGDAATARWIRPVLTARRSAVTPYACCAPSTAGRWPRRPPRCRGSTDRHSWSGQPRTG